MMMPMNEAPVRCELRPTKRRWDSPKDAWIAADERSKEVGITIVPYRCEGCDAIHLTKRTGGIAELVRDSHFEVFKPTNPATRRHALREYLEGRDTVSTDEVAAVADISKPGVGKYMRDLGWSTSRGPGARWRRNEGRAVLHAVQQPDPLEASISRHPAGKHRGNGWTEIDGDRIIHVPLGDLIETFRAAGMELQLRVRKKS